MSLRRQQKGFSLIEAAIVLGIVGLVIGGIWVAATAIQEKMRSNRAMETLMLAVDGAKPLNKSIISGTDITQVLSLTTKFPGGYVYKSPSLSNGKTMFNFYHYGNGQLMAYTTFIGNGPMGTGLDVKFCLEVSQRLMNSNGSLAAIEWSGNPYDDYPFYAYWAAGTAKLDVSNVYNYCSQSHGLNITLNVN